MSRFLSVLWVPLDLHGCGVVRTGALQGAVRQLEALMRALTAQERADDQAVESALRVVLQLANGVALEGSDSRARIAFLLRRQSGTEVDLWLEYLAAALLSSKVYILEI